MASAKLVEIMKQADELSVDEDALQIGIALEAGCDAFLTNDAILSRVT